MIQSLKFPFNDTGRELKSRNTQDQTQKYNVDNIELIDNPLNYRTANLHGKIEWGTLHFLARPGISLFNHASSNYFAAV